MSEDFRDVSTEQLAVRIGDSVMVRNDTGKIIGPFVVKYDPYQLGGGTWVLGLRDISGCYALKRVVLIDKPVEMELFP